MRQSDGNCKGLFTAQKLNWTELIRTDMKAATLISQMPPAASICYNMFVELFAETWINMMIGDANKVT